MSPEPAHPISGSGSLASADEALAYAARYGIEARVQATPPRRLKLQAYADNFR
jgi:hypothetical protein